MLTVETPLPLITRWRKPWLAIAIVGFALVLLFCQLGWEWALSLRRMDFRIPLGSDFAPAAGLALATLVSEDLACATAGDLVRRSALSPASAIVGCFVGIYVGDLGLWLLGRLLAARVMTLPWLRPRLPAHRLTALSEWFDRRGAAAIVAARFLPGTRLPLYVAAGALGRKGRRFALWTFLAAAVWTPLLVLSTANLGKPISGLVRGRSGAWTAVAVIATGYLLARLLSLCATPEGRRRLSVGVAKLRQWEFWPAWVFYAPVAVWIAWLSLRRGGLRGFASVTAANPGIPHGGFVGESKFEILSQLDPRFTLPTVLLLPGNPRQRLSRLQDVIEQQRWEFPIVLKPDVGQRGAGVRVARTIEEAEAYLIAHPSATIAQPYHHGPFESGIFYYRFPNEPRGRIFSITDKQFPVLVGDGRSTVAELILAHPRFRMQANTFLSRNASRSDQVLGSGELLQLAVAGNHCQGTMFRDGSHLRTARLECRIDQIAQGFKGFYFGRFDIRYRDVYAFLAGDEFSIVELNGVTAESTNVYDPSWSLGDAYRTLWRQWSILFRISDANRSHGVLATKPLALLRSIRDDLVTRRTNGGSD